MERLIGGRYAARLSGRERHPPVLRIAEAVARHVNDTACTLVTETRHIVCTRWRREVAALASMFGSFAGLTDDLRRMTILPGAPCSICNWPRAAGWDGRDLPWNLPIALTAPRTARAGPSPAHTVEAGRVQSDQSTRRSWAGPMAAGMRAARAARSRRRGVCTASPRPGTCPSISSRPRGRPGGSGRTGVPPTATEDR